MMDFTEILFDVEDKIQFYNITFRGYLGIWRSYVFQVNPFALSVHKLTKEHLEQFENDEHTQSFGNIMDCVANYHHQNYNRQDCRKDPCDLYEIVSGDRIHNGGSDKYKMNLSKEHYKNVKKEFITKAREVIRNNKIDDICHT